MDLLLVLPVGVLGGLGSKLELLRPGVQDIPPVAEVRYITQRIQFDKPGLRPDGGFEERGSNLPGGAADMLQQTVCELRGSSACGASVSFYGFASNEKFDGMESHWKNLQLADHRTEAVYMALSSLPETKHGWLVVEPPKRWAPAIKSENAQRPWEEMRNKRNALVQTGLTENCRNPDADRVVILKWTLHPPCEVPSTAEETAPNENG